MTELNGEWWSADFNGKVANRAVLEAWGRLEKEGHSVYLLPQKEFEMWYRVSESLLSERAKELDGKGLQGSKVLGGALRLRKEFGGK